MGDFLVRLSAVLALVVGALIAPSSASAEGEEESPVAPSIVADPSDASVATGETVTFTASLEGTPVPTVCWQVSTDGDSWSDLVGDCASEPGDPDAAAATDSAEKSASLTITNVAVSRSGHRYRAVATNAAGSAASSAAVLTVEPAGVAPSVTANPSNQVKYRGEDATFHAEASGTPAPGVKWQVSEGADWSDLADGAGVSGALTTSLTLSSVTTDMSGLRYRAVFANDAGTATSEPAELTVNRPAISKGTPSISGKAQYGQLLTASPGTWTPGTSFSYRWYRWLSDAWASIDGATGITYRLGASDVGNRIRVIVTGSHPDYASAVAASATTSTVVDLPVAISKLDPYYGYFYPNIQDGNRDTQPVTFTLNRVGLYRMRVIDSSGKTVRLTPAKTGNGGTFNWDGRRSDGSLAPPGVYRIVLSASASGKSATKTSESFYLKPGPFAVTGFSRQLGYFYPYVRDGNRDVQTITFSFSRVGAYRLEVINEQGSVVRRTSVLTASAGRWTWDGRKSNGELAPNGKYRVRLRASAGGQAVTRLSETFYLKSGYTWKHQTHEVRSGDQGTPSISGRCFVDTYEQEVEWDEFAYWDDYAYYNPYVYYDPWSDSWSGEWEGGWVGDYVYGEGGYAEIDCRGGTGVMNYAFRVPSNAAKFTWAADLEDHWLDFGYGSISKSGVRRSSTTYRISVKATQYRAVYVNSVTLNSFVKKYY